MMWRLFLFLILLAGAAHAQSGSTAQHSVVGTETPGTNGLQWAPNSASNPMAVSGTFSGAVSPAPSATGTTTTDVTCGTSSTPFGVSGATYLSVSIDSIATQPVALAWGADTAVMTRQVYNGPAVFSWGGGTGSCRVASGTQVITVVTK